MVNKQLEKVKARVLAKVPGSKLKKDEDGNLFVEYRGINLSEEHLLPTTKDELEAWQYADLSVKTTQNFNRTHPIRLEGYSILETRERARGRGGRRRQERKPIPYFGGKEEEDYDGWV